MPVYEYQCNTCGERFELLTRFDAPYPACPKCGADVRRLVSAAAFHLKGSGWYKDHYGLKSGDSKDSGTKDAGAKDGGAKETSKPAEAAPAAPAAAPVTKPTTGGS
jgi:putative FmdB family regulatory protein